MKKILITMAVLTTMVAGAMVFSSFVAPKQEVKSESSEIVLNDNGWEDWTIVTIFIYEKAGDGWRYVLSSDKHQVQRREWCGEPQYRIRSGGEWYPVTQSPVDEYDYCFYFGNRAGCFRM